MTNRYVSDPKLTRILHPIKWLDLLAGIVALLVVAVLLGIVAYGLMPAELLRIAAGAWQALVRMGG